MIGDMPPPLLSAAFRLLLAARTILHSIEDVEQSHVRASEGFVSDVKST